MSSAPIVTLSESETVKRVECHACACVVTISNMTRDRNFNNELLLPNINKWLFERIIALQFVGNGRKKGKEEKSIRKRQPKHNNSLKGCKRWRFKHLRMKLIIIYFCSKSRLHNRCYGLMKSVLPFAPSMHNIVFVRSSSSKHKQEQEEEERWKKSKDVSFYFQHNQFNRKV